MASNVVSPLLTGKAPWHLWLVGAFALLWNGSGAITIFMAQAGKLSVSPDEAEYYAAQATWFVVLTDAALLSAIAAAVALLLRSRTAIWLFGISLTASAVSNACDIAMGTSRALVGRGAMIVTILIVVIAILELMYAVTMARRSVLT